MMKVLWITNIVFPEAQVLLNGFKKSYASGGWMLGAANALLDNCDVTLIVASISPMVNAITQLNGERITYYLFPYGNGNTRVNHEYEQFWLQLTERAHPDVVHIHGTEFSHGLSYVNACGSENVVVSIQGLTSVISEYYDYGLSNRDVFQSITLRDILRGGIYYDKKVFRRRGNYEIELLKKVNHIIGRTDWDKVHAWAINSKATYHFCNEILRDSFYDGCWSYDNCKKHHIFISQANYPIKGFHQVLKALPLVLREYPETIVRVAGSGNGNCTFKQRMMMSGYYNYVSRLIKKLHLNNHVIFVGTLNEKEMRDEYLAANLFICPSAIENSPNSLCEAQILGVPVLASYVGGVPDIMKGNEDYLYRFEEVKMLAYKICQIFSLKEKIDTSIMRANAIQRHNPKLNAKTLYNIYNALLK